MQLFFTFLPHAIGLMGALLILVLGWRGQPLARLMLLALYGLLFFIALGFTPDRWLRAAPTSGFAPQPATAVILGFGYEMAGDQMRPGPANQALLDWVVKNQPQITTLLVQEGVLVALSPALFAP